MNPFFGWRLGLNWDGILSTANAALKRDGNELFTVIFGLMFFKGVLASLAGRRRTTTCSASSPRVIRARRRS